MSQRHAPSVIPLMKTSKTCKTIHLFYWGAINPKIMGKLNMQKSNYSGVEGGRDKQATKGTKQVSKVLVIVYDSSWWQTCGMLYCSKKHTHICHFVCIFILYICVIYTFHNVFNNNRKDYSGSHVEEGRLTESGRKLKPLMQQ